MPAKHVLEEDWSDYDNRKIRDKRDARYFSCTEEWEVDYLKRKIKKTHPFLDETKILAAIRSCCREIAGNHPREPFVECVMGKLTF
jgi:hypothetical protein